MKRSDIIQQLRTLENNYMMCESTKSTIFFLVTRKEAIAVNTNLLQLHIRLAPCTEATDINFSS